MTSEAAVSRSLWQAQVCADTLGSGNWQLFDVVRDLADHRRDAALLIMSRLTEALTSDEHVVALKPRLEELARDAMRLLAVAAPAPTPATPPPFAPTPPGTGSAPVPLQSMMPPAQSAYGSEVVDEKQQLHLSGAAAGGYPIYVPSICLVGDHVSRRKEPPAYCHAADSDQCPRWP